MLVELSANCFRGKESELVQRLNREGKQALAGIQRADGIYTIIGYDRVYYSGLDGADKEILLGDFLDRLPGKH